MEWGQKALKRRSLERWSTVMMMLKIRLVTMRIEDGGGGNDNDGGIDKQGTR